jgi:hypothetical protein
MDFFLIFFLKEFRNIIRSNTNEYGMLINGGEGQLNLKNCTFDNIRMSGGDGNGGAINLKETNVLIEDSFFNNTYAIKNGGFLNFFCFV